MASPSDEVAVNEPIENSEDGKDGPPKREKCNLSKYAYASHMPSSGGLIIAKAQYSGNTNTVVIPKYNLKGLALSSEKIEQKVSFLSLLKHKNEIGTMGSRRVERSCKANRKIIQMGEGWGCLPSLFFPKNEENESVCKITLLIKRTDEVEGESFFVGTTYVILNVAEFRELIKFVSARLDELEGGEGWRHSSESIGSSDRDLLEIGFGQDGPSSKTKFILPSSSDDDDDVPRKKPKQGKKRKDKKRKKCHVVYSSDSE